MSKTRKIKPAISEDHNTSANVVSLDANAGEVASAVSEQTVETGSAAPAQPGEPTPAAKPPSKQQQLAALVVRDEGATLDQIIAATGWLPHTTRAALTGLKKKGYVTTSDKVDGVRTYRAVAPE